MLLRPSETAVIVTSLFFSMSLSIVALPDQVSQAMPNLTLLTLIYWCISLPHKVSVGTGWLTGLFVDILTGSLMGQNALIFSLTAYLSHHAYPRLKHYTLWQQSAFILFFLITSQLFTLWLRKLGGHFEATYLFWISTLSGALFWPILSTTLSFIRRHYRLA